MPDVRIVRFIEHLARHVIVHVNDDGVPVDAECAIGHAREARHVCRGHQLTERMGKGGGVRDTNSLSRTAQRSGQSVARRMPMRGVTTTWLSGTARPRRMLS